MCEGSRYAIANARRPEQWLEQTQRRGFGAEQTEELDLPTAQQEALMMGLRLAEGIDRSAWRGKFGTDIGTFIPASKRETLIQEMFLQETDQTFQLTPAGRQRLDSVLVFLLN